MPRIGLISDTHGLLRPEAVAFLRGSDLIIHEGDIGHAGVLEELASRWLSPSSWSSVNWCGLKWWSSMFPHPHLPPQAREGALSSDELHWYSGLI